MEYYVIGGEFTSLNFHSFVKDTTQIYGPYANRESAEKQWRVVSELNRHKAGYRFVITESNK
jgi:hypothetical protein